MKKLDLFWLHSDCPAKFKLLVHDAVVRSKLLYGLDTAMLTPSLLKKLDTFQLKGLRKILHMKTTFVDRQNTNARVFEKANAALASRRTGKKVRLFSEAYRESRMKQCSRVLLRTSSDPIRFSTLNPNAGIWIFAVKRSGRPKDKWIAAGIGDAWKRLRTEYPLTENAGLEFDVQRTSAEDNTTIINTMIRDFRAHPNHPKCSL